jgi:hypothetical protein
MSTISLLMQVVGAYLTADFISGAVHWIEDTYNVANLFICSNRYHHVKPCAMVGAGLWHTIDTSVYLTLPLCVVNHVTVQSFFCYMVLLFGSFANLVHKWAHTQSTELPWVVVALQRTGILCSARHHRQHHQVDTTCYCAMTNFLNPVLDSLNVWRLLENVICAATGTNPRTKTDSEVVQECREKGHLSSPEQP